MLGIRYAKFAPTTYVLQFSGGKVVREGNGLAFFYFEPRSTIVAVPVASSDAPFIFNEVTADFQALTVQGHLTFRVAEPRRLAALLDYSWKAGAFASDDPEKLPLRVTHAAQTATRAEVQARTLRAALVEADAIGLRISDALRASQALGALGVEVTGFSILAIRPAPETGRALEAEARERLLREADDAVYARRNNAVEQERRIKENELNTEVAVQAKQREIEETKLASLVSLEERRRALVALQAENLRAQADGQSYAAEAQLKPIRSLDPKALQVLAASSQDPRLLVAMAFQEIAANAAKVGNLNISPDLLESLLRPPAKVAEGR